MLNDIHIDIMDYIAPATCADVQFRSMWAEFEWENKVRRKRLMLRLHCSIAVGQLPVHPVNQTGCAAVACCRGTWCTRLS